jgi:two-component system, NtrC family, response regulator PilR
MKKLTGHILVVDDDSEMQIFLRRFLTAEGHRVTTFSSALEAQKLLSEPVTSENDVDVILSDINMPEVNGLDFIKNVKAIRTEIPVVMITAFGSIESAVEAMKAGSHDYLTKPLKVEELYAVINRTLMYRNLERENTFLRKEVKQSWSLGDMIGKSAQMQGIFDLVKRVSQVTANILILGESGTGKEMVARAIHNGGPRATKPFVAINCAAIPEDLLESELFGHAKGSFTGAIAQKRGLFEEQFFLMRLAIWIWPFKQSCCA